MQQLSRKKEITPEEMASMLWITYLEIMKRDILQADKFDREAFYEKNGFDYDKKSVVKESTFLYVFLIYNEVSLYYPEKKEKILYEFSRLLKDNSKEELLSSVKDYSKAWNNAVVREKENSDDSALNNPLYCISKLASIRSFGENGLDIRSIIMFLPFIGSFVDMLRDIFKDCKIV